MGGWFYSKIQSIINDGFTPEYKVIESNLTEEKSFEYEKYFINLIGSRTPCCFFK